MSRYGIVLLPGDGIGPDVTGEAVRVLDVVAAELGITLDYERLDAGAGRWRRTGTALTDAQYDACAKADAMLMGAIGLPDARHPDGTEVAGDVMFRLRFGLDLYAGVRPVRSLPGVPSPLADGGGIDYVVVRENVEGVYASRGAGTNVRDDVVTDTVVVTRTGTAKIARRAFAIAEERRRARGDGDARAARVTCVDKSNVLSTYAFFRRVFDETATGYPAVETDHVYVDAMTLYQVTRPRSFDVVVAENLAGDIISDLSAATVGGLGFAPSGDIGDEGGLFQPAHGSAPDIAGQGVANPAAAILSAAMLLRWLGERHGDDSASRGAGAIERAMASALGDGAALTRDAGGTASTEQAGRAVAEAARRLLS